MKYKSLIPLFLSSLMLIGCGGGGGSDRPESRPSGNLSGTAFDNVLVNSDIKVYDLNGKLLGTGKTDSSGVYNVSISSPTQVVKITATNGSYLEEYTKTIVELEEEDQLHAYVNYSQSGQVTTSVTFYTNIAAGYAEYLMSLGVPAVKAINDANVSISQMLGLDIAKVTPVDILDAKNASPSMTTPLKYSFYTAAISPLTAWISRENNQNEHFFWNSIRFARIAYDDIRFDGKLNGQAATGPISLGVVPIDENIYRNLIAKNILVIANHENNKSNMTPQDVMQLADQLNTSSHVMFSNMPIKGLDSEKPVVSNPTWSEGETISGIFNFGIEVVDIVGIQKTEFKLGTLELVAAEPENPQFEVNTELLEDGIYDAIVKVTNFAGAEKQFTQKVKIANAGIEISSMKPANGEHIRGTYDFSATVTDPIEVTDVKFIIDGSLEFSPSNKNQPLQTINTFTTVAEEGNHTFKIVAENQGGYTKTKTVTFLVDNTTPVVDWPLVDGVYLSGVVDTSFVISDNMSLASAKVFWDGVEQVDFVTDSDFVQLRPSYTINTLGNFEGAHTVSLVVNDLAGNQYLKTKTVNLDWNAPSLNLTASGGVVTGSFGLQFSGADSLGLSGYNIYVDSTLVGTADKDATSYTVRPNASISEGTHLVKVEVVDLAGKKAEEGVYYNFHHIPPVGSKSSTFTSGKSCSDDCMEPQYRHYRITVNNLGAGETLTGKVYRNGGLINNGSASFYRVSNGVYEVRIKEDVDYDSDYYDRNDTGCDRRAYGDISVVLNDGYLGGNSIALGKSYVCYD